MPGSPSWVRSLVTGSVMTGALDYQLVLANGVIEIEQIFVSRVDTEADRRLEEIGREIETLTKIARGRVDHEEVDGRHRAQRDVVRGIGLVRPVPAGAGAVKQR